MLEDYIILRQEKELECRRQRDQKKLHDQFIAEQEVLFGSKHTFSFKYVKCIFLGYFMFNKGCLCLNPMNGETTISKDVIFHEDDFFVAIMLEGKKGKAEVSHTTTNNICVFKSVNKASIPLQIDALGQLENTNSIIVINNPTPLQLTESERSPSELIQELIQICYILFLQILSTINLEMLI